jgi:protein-disulfide isomerase
MKWLLAVACVLAASAAPFGAPLARADRLGFDSQTVYKIPLGTSPVVGPANAPITIVAWSDFACGYCYRVQFTLDALERLYPGQLRWVHRTLPLDEEMTVGAEASLAAGAQGRFKPMSDRIYAVGGRIDRAAAELIARELGLDMVRFRADLDSGTYKKQLAADVADAVTLGVTGTPTFFINGRPVHGNQPLKVFADVVDEELVRAAKTPGGYDALVGQGKPTADTPRQNQPGFELDGKQTYRVGLGLPGHQSGPDTAPVTIVAWGDFQCPFCSKMAPVLQHARDKYGNDVRVVYRHLAMRFHKHAMLAAEASIVAANQGKFWAFHDKLFAANGAIARPDLERYAKEIGMDVTALRAALDDRRYRDVVAAETADAEALGVDGTPTVFVNGAPVVGSRTIADFDQIIDQHLAQARSAMQGGIQAGDVYALFMSGAQGVERADPSRIPDPAAAKVSLRPDDRGRAVAAACRRRDRTRAIELANGLAGAPRAHASLVCAAGGIDLP